jgi:hypothetical protein
MWSCKVFVPLYSRLSPTEALGRYLFGKNISEALILSCEMLEFHADEEGRGYAGCFAEVCLLLGFRVAYPASNGRLDEYPKIVLRHNESFCGGRVLEIASVESIEVEWENDSLGLDLQDVQGKLRNSSKKNELRCKWDMAVNEKMQISLSVADTYSSGYQHFYTF